MSDDAKPYPKAAQLARQTGRSFRVKANRAEWERITAAKLGPCRVCGDPGQNGRLYGRIAFHHLVSRARGGDDVAENIVPLCPSCHERVSLNDPRFLGPLGESLTEAEREYVLGKLGPSGLERLYGVGR